MVRWLFFFLEQKSVLLHDAFIRCYSHWQKKNQLIRKNPNHFKLLEVINVFMNAKCQRCLNLKEFLQMGMISVAALRFFLLELIQFWISWLNAFWAGWPTSRQTPQAKCNVVDCTFCNDKHDSGATKWCVIPKNDAKSPVPSPANKWVRNSAPLPNGLHDEEEATKIETTEE